LEAPAVRLEAVLAIRERLAIRGPTANRRPHSPCDGAAVAPGSLRLSVIALWEGRRNAPRASMGEALLSRTKVKAGRAFGGIGVLLSIGAMSCSGVEASRAPAASGDGGCDAAGELPGCNLAKGPKEVASVCRRIGRGVRLCDG
jgi:hypothetical protein